MRLAVLALVPALLAAAPGHYHPDLVAAESATFRRYAEALGPRFDEAQRALSRAGEQLAELEVGVLLLGPRATEDLRAHYEDSRRRYTHGYLRTQAHVSLLEEDSLVTFSRSMEAAIGQLSPELDLTECAAATGLAAMTGPGRTGAKTCEGADANARIAALMDADPALNAAVDEILSIEWPEVAASPGPMAATPLTGSAGWVALAPLAERLIGARIAAQAAALEERLDALERELPRDDPEYVAQAQAARAVYEAAMASEGERLLAALEARARKLGLDLAVCANPAGLGGCEGEDLSATLTPQLAEDKKLIKALSR